VQSGRDTADSKPFLLDCTSSAHDLKVVRGRIPGRCDHFVGATPGFSIMPVFYRHNGGVHRVGVANFEPGGEKFDATTW
jgi:hypothetical protein